jgi:CheY-like chemotaxis protein
VALDLRVLIVEDVPAEAELAVRQLERSGIGCVHHRVDTEPAFRRALGDFRPHLILSDFTIPAFDGLAALDIAAEHAPDVPSFFSRGPSARSARSRRCAVERWTTC